MEGCQIAANRLLGGTTDTLQVVLTAPGHQMVNLPPVGDYRSNESGVICKLQELDRPMTRCAAVCIQYRGKAVALGGSQACKSKTCFPSFTCCLLSDRKSVICQAHSTGRACPVTVGMIVLKAELKSTNRILT